MSGRGYEGLLCRGRGLGGRAHIYFRARFILWNESGHSPILNPRCRPLLRFQGITQLAPNGTSMKRPDTASRNLLGINSRPDGDLSVPRESLRRTRSRWNSNYV